MTILANFPVNRSDFRVIRGVQNEILFRVRDLDRNPADTTQFTALTINLVSPYSNTLLLSRQLTPYAATVTVYVLTLLAGETVDWETGPLRWSISVARSDGATVMLWTDMSYSPYSTLEVTDGPVPGPKVPLTLDPSTFLLDNFLTYSPPLIGAVQTGYQNGMQTFALYLTLFTGSVTIQATLQALPTASDWFGVVTRNYTQATAIDPISLAGNYLWLRVAVKTLSGNLNQILYAN
jgi:hypothetical protein